MDGDEKIKNKYLPIVLEEIKQDPYFDKQNNLLRYNAPAGNKVIAVWDARDLGAFEISNQERFGLDYEFLLKIIHESFDKIYERVVKEKEDIIQAPRILANLKFVKRGFKINSHKFSPQQFFLLNALYPPKDYIKTNVLRNKIVASVNKKSGLRPKVILKQLTLETNKVLENLKFPVRVVGRRTRGYRLEVTI